MFYRMETEGDGDTYTWTKGYRACKGNVTNKDLFVVKEDLSARQ